MHNTDKRIVIHAGPGKTGTSAIQAWLSQNEEILLENSIFYPRHNLPKNEISSGNIKEILSQNKEGKWQVDEALVNKLLNSFERSTYKVLLLSSEFFFHHIKTIHKYIPQAEYIAYIRNPVELIQSNYNQSVKRECVVNLFQSPSTFNSNMWRYLTNLFTDINGKLIHLRPYDFSLMQGGDIVTDLLSVLGLTVESEKRNVNPSYTLQALEFKRLINHFEPRHLQVSLDAILQACPIGEPSYSLMKVDVFENLNKEGCKQMSVFIDKYEQKHLVPLLDNFRNSQQKKYIPQDVTARQLSEIVNYIKSLDMNLYTRLKALIESQPCLLIDNPAIYQIFDVGYVAPILGNLIDEDLLRHINQFGVHPDNRAKVTFNVAAYFESQGEYDNALKFAKTAYHLDPNDGQGKRVLNRLLAKNVRTSNIFSKVLSYSLSWVLKLKHRLLG